MSTAPSPAASSSTGSWRLLARFIRDFTPGHRGLAAVGALLTAVVAAATFSYAPILGWLGGYLDRGALASAWPVPLVIVAATSVRAIALYAQVSVTQTFAVRVMESVQKAMHAHVLRLDLARMTAAPAGEMVSRFISDVERLRDALSRMVTNFGRDMLVLLAGAGWMLWSDWLLAVLVLGVYPLAFQPVTAVGRRIRRAARQAQGQVGALTNLLTESFAGARLVKTYQLEGYQTDRANTAFAERRGLEARLARQRAQSEPILEIAGGIGLAGVIAFAVWRAQTTGFGFENLLSFVGAVAIMAPAARSLGNLNAFVQQGLATAARVFELLDEAPTIIAAPSASALVVTTGQITFQDVRFSYDGGPPALDGVSLTIAPGATTALVGPSGSGKTTVMNLIPRLYDVTAGRVCVDGQDVRTATLASVRGAVALVSQDITLFDDTIRANIAFGRTGATDAAIIDAADAAAVGDLIAQLPGGLDAPVGPGGARLSGGQRQRIALARAFLKDAPILLLDEATSALDAESEAQIQEALQRLSAGRTTLVIAHRLATVRAADHIYVLNQGRIVEAGDDATLSAKPGGLYAHLRALQFSAD